MKFELIVGGRCQMNPKDAYMQVNLFLARTYPHLYFLSKYLRVVYYDTMDFMARTNGKELHLTKKWLQLPYQIRIAVVLHELYHVLLKHPIRAQAIAKSLKVDPFIVNVAADAKTNYVVLNSLSKKLSDISNYAKFLSTFGVPRDLLERASVEEIVMWLLHNAKTSEISPTAGVDLVDAGGTDDTGSSESGGSGKSDKSIESSGGSDESNTNSHSGASSGSGEILNEGSKELVEATANDIEAKLTKIIRNSLLSAKVAGATLSEIEQRLLDQLVKSKVDWRSIFKSYITSYINNLVIQSYKKPNRRFKDLPGSEQFSKPKAWVFIDVSGSIGSDEFRQFMSEVVRLSAFVSETTMITWDVRATSEYNFRSKVNPRKLMNLKFKGGGGTRFAPVLQNYTKRIKHSDVMIVLTDGIWFDESDAYMLLKRVPCLKILVTTHSRVPGFDKIVEIGGEEDGKVSC